MPDVSHSPLIVPPLTSHLQVPKSVLLPDQHLCFAMQRIHPLQLWSLHPMLAMRSTVAMLPNYWFHDWTSLAAPFGQWGLLGPVWGAKTLLMGMYNRTLV